MAAEAYLLTHGVELPRYAELGASGSAMLANDGNPPAGPTTSDEPSVANATDGESMDAMADAATSLSGESQPIAAPDVQMEADELVKGGPGADGAVPPPHSGA